MPTLRLATRPAEEIRRRAERLQPDLAAHYADFAVSAAASRRLAAARYRRPPAQRGVDLTP